MVKEEVQDETVQIAMSNLANEDDEIIASYDIVFANNPKFKLMSVSGLSNVVDRTSQYDVIFRIDSKEVKIASKLNDTLSVCYTKESNMNLDRKSFAVKLSRETKHAYFVPITSMHSISFLDEENKSNKLSDPQNMIYEDCFKMPHPSRNKHDQLCIEMKPHLYKSLHSVVQPELVKQFLAELFTSGPTKRHQHIFESSTIKKIERKSNPSDTVDMMNCPQWHMNRVNLYDIKQIEGIEFQLEALMRKGQVLTFSEIQEILSVESSKLINILPTIALLVLGNWVIKSNSLYKSSPFNDGEAKQKHYKDLIAARDFLLWCIASKKRITFAEIYPKFKSSPDHEEILNRLTIRRGIDEPLSFILPEDEGFLRMYSTNVSSLHKNTMRLLEKNKSYLDT